MLSTSASASTPHSVHQLSRPQASSATTQTNPDVVVDVLGCDWRAWSREDQGPRRGSRSCPRPWSLSAHCSEAGGWSPCLEVHVLRCAVYVHCGRRDQNVCVWRCLSRRSAGSPVRRPATGPITCYAVWPEDLGQLDHGPIRSVGQAQGQVASTGERCDAPLRVCLHPSGWRRIPRDRRPVWVAAQGGACAAMGHSSWACQPCASSARRVHLCEGAPAVAIYRVCIFCAAHRVLVLVQFTQERVAVHPEQRAQPGLGGIHAHTPGYLVPHPDWGPWWAPLLAVEGEVPHY